MLPTLPKNVTITAIIRNAINALSLFRLYVKLLTIYADETANKSLIIINGNETEIRVLTKLESLIAFGVLTLNS
jgi:hypothetical protein